jgi:hypothetical protein
MSPLLLTLRFRGGRVWHRVREVREVGNAYRTLPTVCGYSGEAVAETRYGVTAGGNLCKRCSDFGGSSDA